MIYSTVAREHLPCVMERPVISKENMHINIYLPAHQKACQRAENGSRHSKWRRTQQVTGRKRFRKTQQTEQNFSRIKTVWQNVHTNAPFSSSDKKPEINTKIYKNMAGRVLPSMCHSEAPLLVVVVVEKHPSEETGGVPWRQPGRNRRGRAEVPSGSLLLQEVLPQDLHQVLIQPDVLGHGRHSQRVLVAHGRLLGHPHASPVLLPLLGAKTKKCPLIQR